jgi:hypothetical protein
MAKYRSIAEAQKYNLNDLDSFTQDVSGFKLIDKDFYDGVNKILFDYGIDFQKILADVLKNKNITASGNLADSVDLRPYEDQFGMDVYLADYFDYPNKGVKGVRSSKNAPNSPYQYKNYGMSAEGRASIKKYIESGKAKVETIQNNRSGIQASEQKKLPLIDLQTNTLIYLIKRYGIKASNYLDEAIAIAFKTLPEDLALIFADKIKLKIVQ